MTRCIRLVFGGAATAALAACAAVAPSPQMEIETGLIDLGFSNGRAECFAAAIDERLETEDAGKVADLVSAAEGGEGFLSAARGVSEPEIAAALTAASMSCAFASD